MLTGLADSVYEQIGAVIVTWYVNVSAAVAKLLSIIISRVNIAGYVVTPSGFGSKVLNSHFLVLEL